MKLRKDEKEKLSAAIDKMNEGLEVFIDYYNDSEEDTPIIPFDEEVLALLDAGKTKYGEDLFNKKINAIMKEVLSFISNEKEQ
ncbi:atypical membrane-integrating protein (Mistic protein) [Sutcliffiella rhizosphaerae]|uniref:Protein mistic n=1 Tax=Sutcliffiella rhizosphaerae TaxID=2880967 RepID=A0ABN8AAN4_9BACI|nr:atypical membrane-integrating protein (Mistic protein) [Sutcliffiella rhizosphaerae]CAG9620976.1 Protein mistic [Sutcliffiella rhizosphaerae]